MRSKEENRLEVYYAQTHVVIEGTRSTKDHDLNYVLFVSPNQSARCKQIEVRLVPTVK